MVSRRYRAKNTVNTRLGDLASRVAKNEKKSTTPKANEVNEEILAPASVAPATIQNSAVDSNAQGPGSVGTENLGIVNELNSDGNLVINIPGYVYLNGAAYPLPSTGNSKTLVLDDAGKIVLGESAQGEPTGSIRAWPVTTIPSGFLECNGQAVSRTTYSALFSVISTNFGVGDGSTTFNVPDLRGRRIVGLDTTDTAIDTLGETGGSKTHSHTLSDAGQAQVNITTGTAVRTRQVASTSWTSASSSGTTSGTTTSTAHTSAAALMGSTDSASNLDPFMALKYIIKASTSSGSSVTTVDTVLGGRVTTLETTGYRYLQTVTFTSSGTFSKASYPTARAARIRLVGGGGAGGGAVATSSGNHSDGGGGGGGGYAEKFTLLSALAASVTVTVGAGGIGGTGVGGSGGDSSFSTICIATGGAGGGAGGNTALAIGYPGGTYGIGTAGDLLVAGSEGGMVSGNATLPRSGQGGNSVLGGGAGGVYTGSTGGKAVGVAGGNYGGGGSGAGNAQSAATATAGGNGAPGVVIVELYA